MWLHYILEDNDAMNKLRNFIKEKMKGFIGKEVIVNVGAVIQKGDELCLDGFFGIELIPKNSDVDKFNFEGKLRFVKSERKIYVVALIIVLIILPYIKIEIRTDLNIIEWLYNYSKLGSARRELDDKLYIYLNFINTLLELKNVKILVKDDKAGMQETLQDVTIPAIKKELISCKKRLTKWKSR
jgi:hypothetical protein